jgi:predicted O-methyltransferase YrrM
MHRRDPQVLIMNALPDVLIQALASKVAFAPDGTTRPLESNISREEAESLYSAVRSIQPVCSLEIGLAHGISALAILAAIFANGSSGHHYVIDPFQRNYANCGKAMITLAGFADRHTFLEQFPEEAIPHLPRLQFAFIDASHLFDFTMMEFALVDKKLDVGGIVALHDLWMPSIQAVIRFIRTNRAYQIRRDFSGPVAALTSRQRSTVLVSRLLNKVPGIGKYLKTSVLDPWFTFQLKNVVFLEKIQNDSRDWRFHRQF